MKRTTLVWLLEDYWSNILVVARKIATTVWRAWQGPSRSVLPIVWAELVGWASSIDLRTASTNPSVYSRYSPPRPTSFLCPTSPSSSAASRLGPLIASRSAFASPHSLSDPDILFAFSLYSSRTWWSSRVYRCTLSSSGSPRRHDCRTRASAHLGKTREYRREMRKRASSDTTDFHILELVMGLHNGDLQLNSF